jgi:hypothetical protein
MSGRVRVKLADGRVTTGYRKTLARRSPARPLEDRLHEINERYRRRYPQGWKPDVRLGFRLPKSLAPFVSSGPHGLGVNVISGFVQICGASSHECIVSALAFLHGIAKGLPFSVFAVVSSSDFPERKHCRYLTVNAEKVESSGGLEPRIYG